MSLLVLATLLTFGNTPEAHLSNRFISAIQADHIGAVRALAGLDSDLGAPLWRSLRELVEKYDCIAVSSSRVEVERQNHDLMTIRVDLSGTAVTSGSPRRKVTLPPVWSIEAGKDGETWRIRSVMSAEQRAAAVILRQTSDAGRWAVIVASELDLSELADEISDQAQHNEAGRQALDFAVTLSQAIGDPAVESVCLRRFAAFHITGRNLTKARDAAKEGLVAARKARSSDALAGALFSMGITDWFRNDIWSAVDYLDQAGSMADSVEDPRISVKSLYMAAYILQGRGALSAALSRAQRCQALSRKYGWRTGELDALMITAEIHDQLRNDELFIQLSRRAYEEALEIGEQSHAAMALHNIAAGESSMGHCDRAITSLQQMFHLGSKGLARAHGGATYDLLGLCLLEQGRWDEAATALEESLQLARAMDDRRQAHLTLARLSELRHAQGQFWEALFLAREAIEIAKAGDGGARGVSLFRPWMAKVAEGRALARLCRTDEAIADFREAIALIEQWQQTVPAGETTRIHSFRGTIDPYLSLVDVMAQQGAAREALEVSEQFKARALRDVIEGGRADLDSLMSEEERSRERALNQKIVDLNRARADAEAATRDQLDESLRRAQDELQTFSESIYLTRARRPVRSDRASRQLTATRVPEDALILDYVVTEESVVLFTIARNGAELDVQVRRLPIGRKELNARIGRFTQAIERRDLRWRTEARSLYDLLLRPVESLLPSRSTICIVPDDVLWQLPFHALARHDGRPLLDAAAIFYAPSLAFLDQTIERQRISDRRKPALLAFGNPEGAAGTIRSEPSLQRGKLGPLPDAEAEVRAIAALYERADVYIGAAARESILKQQAGRYDVLHFATHGLVDDRSPMFSALLLSAGDGNDGLLEARELLRLDLNANLAILSACDTGRGAIYPGEGVVGLSWSFLLAGCPTSVVSRWRIDSKSTTELMIALHRQLVGTTVSTSEALRRAAMALRRQPQYRHPYYWASFQVVGVGW